jgi:nucleoid-associated protein YgaU
MPTGRWKKLAIAGAILIVGIGTALVFRREQSGDGPVAAKAPEQVMQPAADRAAKRQPQPEPALAGRIEPYFPPAQTESVRDASASFTSVFDKTVAPTGSPLKWQTVPRPDETGTIAQTQPDHGAVDRPMVGSPPAVSRPATEVRHKIVDGDTLAGLARRYLGGEQRLLDLFEYNRDVLVTPELLPIGKVLRIPPRDFAPAQAPSLEPQSRDTTTAAVSIPMAQEHQTAPTPAPISTAITAGNLPAQTYVVQQHDTLALIARKLYGDISRQADLMAANRALLRSAKDLRPGMRLVVPAAAASRQGRLYDGLPRPSN